MFKALPKGINDEIFVFTLRGKPMTCIREAFTAACKQAGIENFVFHDLRHCFCTNAFRSGMPITLIQAITGHKSLVMFMRSNTIQAQDLKAAIANMPQ